MYIENYAQNLEIKPVYITENAVLGMFKKIIANLKFGACKTIVLDDKCIQRIWKKERNGCERII